MIYITGDTHNLLDIGKIKKFLLTHKTSLNDYLIICGDYGVPGFRKTLENDDAFEFWKNVPITILYIDGNHENFNELNKLPIEEWNGGKIQKLSDNIIHLMRGQVYTIDNKKFFTMGGATSIDKIYRTPNIDWFPEEDCNYQETEEALQNLENHNFMVDFIITHTIGEEFILRKMSKNMTFYADGFGAINRFLDYIDDVVSYKHWYFGHFHMDVEYLNENKECLYYLIKKID